MADSRSLTTISNAEYESIEAAVMETARGRWFLAEYARRNRTADTQVLLDAIGRLEQVVVNERTAQGIDRLRFDLMEMAKAITRTKSEIASIHPADQDQSRLVAATEALDGVLRTTERATSDILEAAEHVQEAAWTLREAGAQETLCDELDRRATQIYTACSFQDLTAQRTAKIVHTLRYLEGRINAMIEIWDTSGIGLDDPQGSAEAGAPAPAPWADEGDLSQTDIDAVIVDVETGADEYWPTLIDVSTTEDMVVSPGEVEALPAPETAQAEQEPPPFARLRAEAFAEIDALDTREKLRRFT